MNRDFVERALAQAERHVDEGEAILTRQRAAIVASERIGGDVARFKELYLSLKTASACMLPIEIGCGKI